MSTTHKQRVLDLLRDGKPHQHGEIYALGVIGHSRIADLRKDGHQIDCWTETLFGERVSVYQLVGSSEPPPNPSPNGDTPLLLRGPERDGGGSLEPAAVEVHPSQPALFDRKIWETAEPSVSKAAA